MSKIQVLEIKSIDNSNLKAFVKIKIGNVVFHDFRIIQQPNQKAWVSPPATSWLNEKGNRQWKTVVEFPQPLKEAISDSILRAWEQQS